MANRLQQENSPITYLRVSRFLAPFTKNFHLQWKRTCILCLYKGLSGSNNSILYCPSNVKTEGEDVTEEAELLHNCFALLHILAGARGVMVIVVGNGHGDTSSNPGRDW